jgi:hypothetical protein
MTERVSLDYALADPNLLGAGLGPIETWQRWRTVLKAAFGQSLNPDEALQFAAVAGGRQPPAQRVREPWAILGRRSGKSRIAAALSVFFALLVDHTGKLAPGEVAMCWCWRRRKIRRGQSGTTPRGSFGHRLFLPE